MTAPKRALAAAPVTHPTMTKAIGRVLAKTQAEALSTAQAANANGTAHGDSDSTRIRLRVEDLKLYEGNPRENPNERYHELKEGLRSTGFVGSMLVTQRPKESAFVLSMGSNTTLRALKELWSETRNPKYEWVDCTIQAYRNETWMLTQHLVENNNRGTLTFWDNAKGFMRLKAELERAAGTELSVRAFEAELPKHGLTVSKTQLSLYAFATARLKQLGSATAALTTRGTDAIRTRLSLLKRLAELHGIEEVVFWRMHVDPILTEFASRYVTPGAPQADLQDIGDAVEKNLAQGLDVGSASVRSMVAILARDPGATLADIQPRTRKEPLGESQRRGGSTQSKGSNASLTSQRAPLDAFTVSPREAYVDLAAKVHDQRTNTAPLANYEVTHEIRLNGGCPHTVSQQRCRELAVRLATATEVGDCIELDETLPLGFFVEVPDLGGGPALPDQSGTTRHRRAAMAWWTLASISGQLKEAFADAAAPAGRFARSRFFATWRDEHRYVEFETRILGPSLTERVLEWILDPSDETGRLLLDLLSAISDHNRVAPT